MTEKIIDFLLPYVTHLISAVGYPGIALLMGIESTVWRATSKGMAASLFLSGACCL